MGQRELRLLWWRGCRLVHPAGTNVKPVSETTLRAAARSQTQFRPCRGPPKPNEGAFLVEIRSCDSRESQKILLSACLSVLNDLYLSQLRKSVGKWRTGSAAIKAYYIVVTN